VLALAVCEANPPSIRSERRRNILRRIIMEYSGAFAQMFVAVLEKSDEAQDDRRLASIAVS
jgi:peptidoglycan biosynthesis protein MviN/MurJ (putative lipid II flippase)